MVAGLIIGVLVAVPVVLFVVLLAVLPMAIHADRARRAILREWAAAHGWTYSASSRAPWTTRLPGRNGRGLGVTMSGQFGGRWVTVAEYSYRTTSSNGDSTTTTTHRFIVVLVLLDRMYPPVGVYHRGLLSQLGRAMFGDKPTATGNVLFDSRFKIAAADPVCAKALVGPRLIDAHIARAVPQWSIVGAELLTCIPASGKLRDPNQVIDYAASLLRVADLLGH
jgi:hypothetical protein